MKVKSSWQKLKKDFLEKSNNTPWLFINTGARDGAFNMSFDNYLFYGLLNGKFQSPILRLYGWSEPTISLGVNQKMEDKSTYSLPVVRRVTGGQAVFHEGSYNELTYSVCLFYSGGVKELYQKLGKVFFYFLQMYGLNPRFGYSDTDYRKHFNCFLSSTSSDIVVDDIKVIGSAQYREKKCILQHGSIKLAKIRELSKGEVDFDSAVSTLKSSFAEVLKIDFFNFLVSNATLSLV